MLMVSEWCRRRSRMAAARTWSLKVSPLAVGLVGGEDDGAALVAASHQLEQEVCGGPVEGEVAHLVDNEELGLAEGGQAGRHLLWQEGGEPAGGGEGGLAASPRAMARCVLPTPGGPRKTTFSALAMKRRVANSLTRRSSMEGWKLKSNWSMVLMKGKGASLVRISTGRARLMGTSSSRSLSRNST